jgi:hypothetical protein
LDRPLNGAKNLKTLCGANAEFLLLKQTVHILNFGLERLIKYLSNTVFTYLATERTAY